MPDTKSLLFANDAFYSAFADRDMDAMADVWSREHPVSCLHPGWGPLIGRSEVISSWAAILSSPDAPDIRCVSPKASVYNSEAGLVMCFERLRTGLLVASNMFVREGSVWKMVHHQGGPTSIDVEVDDTPEGAAVH